MKVSKKSDFHSKNCNSREEELLAATNGRNLMNRFILFFKRQPAGRLITLGFAAAILFGTLLLLLPVSVRSDAEVSFIDALFTSTSAVCVTGLIAIDTADHFTPFGQGVVAFLIQIGGLGVTSVGVGLILAVGKHIGIKGRLLAQEGLNVSGVKGIVRLVKSVLFMTLFFELTGAVLSFLVFIQDYPLPKAIGTSIFHSIAAFNNSGFDIFGGLQNMIPYQNNILLNLTTCGLIIFGGLGFLVILDILKHRSFKKLTLHSKVVITTSIILLAAGTLLLKATEDISWLGAFFHSVSARTAGFSTYPLGTFSSRKSRMSLSAEWLSTFPVVFASGYLAQSTTPRLSRSLRSMCPSCTARQTPSIRAPSASLLMLSFSSTSHSLYRLMSIMSLVFSD